MPQFDTFTFLSQVTWVFFLFGIVYLSISYSLSPITATILKVRKLKFLDIKKSSSTETSNKNLLATNSIKETSLLNGIISLKAIGFSLWALKWNLNIMEKKYSFVWDIYTNFFSQGFLIESLFLKNKFRNILLRSIYSI